MFTINPPLQLGIALAFVTILMPLFAGIARYRTLTTELRGLVWFCGISFVLDGASSVIWLYNTSNLWIGHLHTILEFMVLANLYRLTLKGFAPRQLLPLVMIGFALLAIVNTVLVQQLSLNNSYIKILEALLLIALAMAWFYKAATELTVQHMEREAMFWISCGMLLYFAGNLFVFLFSNQILHYSAELGVRLWFIHAVFFTIFNVLLMIGLWSRPKN